MLVVIFRNVFAPFSLRSVGMWNLYTKVGTERLQMGENKTIVGENSKLIKSVHK